MSIFFSKKTRCPTIPVTVQSVHSNRYRPYLKQKNIPVRKASELSFLFLRGCFPAGIGKNQKYIPLSLPYYMLLTLYTTSAGNAAAFLYITFWGFPARYFTTLSNTITARFTIASLLANATWGVSIVFLAVTRG